MRFEPESPIPGALCTVRRDESLGAVGGDRVVARLVYRGRRGRLHSYAARVLEILEADHRVVVGRLVRGEGLRWVLLPDGRDAGGMVAVEDADDPVPLTGYKAVARLVGWSDDSRLPTARLEEVLGPCGDTRVETTCVLRLHEIVEAFPREVLEQAERTRGQAGGGESRPGREDLRGLTLVTIDPREARDFDDAVSLEWTGEGTRRLGVHIADVAHHVEVGSSLDVEARRRGTSVYLPDRAVPMLPEALSADVCSLVPGEPRLAISVFMDFDRAGARRSVEVVRSVIRSSARLSYREAQQMIDGEREPPSEAVGRLLGDLARLARGLRDGRRRRGMLSFELPEERLVLGADGALIGAAPRRDDFTHTMVEMCMLEANEVVAALLADAGVTFLRRVHPEPEIGRLEELSALARSLGRDLPASPTRGDLQRLVDGAPSAPIALALSMAVVRALPRASYSDEPIGHYALASRRYCHFTSPIRRYPDLTVHRLVGAYLDGALEAAPAQPPDQGARCSDLERRAMRVEQEARTVVALAGLADRIGETFEGTAVGVIDKGLFVRHPDLPIEGLLPLRELEDEWWEASPAYGLVRGESTGRIVRVGDLLEVVIARVDMARRHLDLSLGGSGLAV